MNTVYGVVVSTKEGSSYGLRHVENIWKKTKLAWSTGFVTESHGNTLDSKDYAAMMGQTINKVTYYTDQGIYEIPMDQQVAKKFDGEVSVADVSVKSEKTAITVSGLPNDFEEEYKIDGIDEDAYSVEIKSDGKTTTRTINFKTRGTAANGIRKRKFINRSRKRKNPGQVRKVPYAPDFYVQDIKIIY